MTTGITVTVTGHLDANALREMVRPGGMVYEGAENAADMLADRARQNVYAPFGRVDTGYMADTIHEEPEDEGFVEETEAVFLVGSDAEYDIYQHEGTSRGITPAPFMTDAAEQLFGANFTRH